MPRQLTIDEYLVQDDLPPLIDVRTPAEFAQGHVPGAFNIPLFSNEERVSVGTTYKQKSREEAILLGFDLVGNKWSGFIREALKIAPDKKVAVHCWRGGMRSGAMAWAFELYGFEVQLIRGGYKSYRQWAMREFEKQRRLVILGGMTGSGKTEMLYKLQSAGEQMIDLEAIAQHQGSAYGSMDRLVQPTQEQFENDLAFALHKTWPQQPLWVEDESLTIGKRSIPQALWKQMRAAALLFLEVPQEERVKRLTEQYGVLDKDFLIESTERICKRLGPEQTKHAIQAINESRMADFIRLALVYYDKSYRKGLSERTQDKVLVTGEQDISSIIQSAKQLLWKRPSQTLSN